MTLLAALAHAGDPLRVVVRIREGDEALLERVKGQTSDLSVELITKHGALEPALPDQLDTANTLASESSAEVVVWFDAAADEKLLVIIATPKVGRVLVRVVAATSPDKRSSTLESAALTVRSALKALASGALIGLTREETLSTFVPVPPPTIEPTPTEPPTPTVTPPPVPPEKPEPKRPPVETWRFVAAAGWQVAIDGNTPYGQNAPSLRIGVASKRIAANLVGTFSIPADIHDEEATLTLTRYTLEPHASVELQLVDRIALVTELGFGLAAYRRETRSISPAVEPTPSTYIFSPLLSFEESLKLKTIESGRFVLRLSLVLGLDIIFIAPTFTYSGSPTSHAIWPLQPRLGLLAEVMP